MIEDNEKFIKKFGFDEDEFDFIKLAFRMNLLKEEYNEATAAYLEGNAEELVDAHIDMMVIILGNLYLAGVDIERAWKEVFKANMMKKIGTKDTRPESRGWDVIKPKNWVPPNHSDNHGVLDELFKDEEKS